MNLTATVDATAKQASPSSNFGSIGRLLLRGTGSSLTKYVYIHFTRPFPLDAIVTAATLTVYRYGTWSASKTLTVNRVQEKWSESTLTWNNKPAVASLHSASIAAGAGADKSAIDIDLTDMFSDIADGATYFGIRIALTQDVDVALRSGEDGNPLHRPQLDLGWTVLPGAPDSLDPAEANAVSLAKPVLHWRLGDDAGFIIQDYSQVQVSTSIDFSSPYFDTGKVANGLQQYDLDDGVFASLSNGNIRYWRVKIWDEEGNPSAYSEVAQFQRQSLGTLSIDSPGSTAPETTPPIEWTLSGRTQRKYRVTLYSVAASGALTELWQTHATDSVTTARTPDAGLIKTGTTYRAKVEVWDTIERADDEHLTQTQDFTYVRDGSPDPPATLTATPFVNSDGIASPAVQLDWTRSVAPDFWSVRESRDGGSSWVEVEDRLSTSDAHVSGDNYRFVWWGAKPRKAYTYEIEAVVLDGGKLKHSAGNPNVTATMRPVGIWLADKSDIQNVTAVVIVGTEPADLQIGETGTTYDVIGRQTPVRITDIIRGYEGSVSGILLSSTARDTFLDLKALQANLFLILGDLSFPIRMEEAHVDPTPEAGDLQYAVGFAFFQAGGPWPVVLTG